MTLKLIGLAALVLGALAAICILIVVPGEKREYERRMALIQKKLEQRNAGSDEGEIT